MDRPKRILIVDDEEVNRELLIAMVEALGHEYETAEDGFDALAKLNLDIDLVLLDIMMPGMDGFEVARRVREDLGMTDLPIIMVTALTAKADRLRAVEMGANDFIAKPVDKMELRVRVTSLLRIKEAQDALKQYQARLESTVEKRTSALRKALDEMAEAQRMTYEAHLETIHRLAVAAEFRDEVTAQHIHRMSHFSAVLARRTGLAPMEVETILHASPMHDVGKIGVPDAILLKKGGLTEEEWHVMRQHTIIGGRILSGSKSKLLQLGEVIALAHHERWDGTGYPKGLVGEVIPVEGRICTIADVFDALTTQRPYKKAFTNTEAVEIMRGGRETDFDPRLLDLFLENLDEIVDIQQKYQDSPKEPEQRDLLERR